MKPKFSKATARGLGREIRSRRKLSNLSVEDVVRELNVYSRELGCTHTTTTYDWERMEVDGVSLSDMPLFLFLSYMGLLHWNEVQDELRRDRHRYEATGDSSALGVKEEGKDHDEVEACAGDSLRETAHARRNRKNNGGSKEVRPRSNHRPGDPLPGATSKYKVVRRSHGISYHPGVSNSQGGTL